MAGVWKQAQCVFVIPYAVLRGPDEVGKALASLLVNDGDRDRISRNQQVEVGLARVVFV